MKIQSATIENFLTIETAKLELVDKGLVLIQGDNRDDSSAKSNGAGKSSLPDAISWCLWGETARGAKGDDVVRTNFDAASGEHKMVRNTRVQVVLIDGDHVYEVTRHRKHKAGKNTLTLEQTAPTAVTLTKGTDKLTQVEVERILGCSQEVFNAAIYAAQERMPDLPSLTDKPLKVLVEEAAGITVLERCNEVARKRLADVNNLLETAQRAVDARADEIARLDEDIERLGEESKRWGDAQQEKIRDEKIKVRAAKDEYDIAQREIDTLDPKKIEADIAAIEAKIAGVKGERAQQDELSRIASKKASEVSIAEHEVTRIKNDARSAKAKLDRIDSVVGTNCGECGKEYCEHDIETAKAAATEKLREFLTALRDAQKKHGACVESAQSAQEALRAFTASMTDLTATSAPLGALRASLRDVDQLEAKKTVAQRELRQRLKRIEELKAEKNPFEAILETKTTSREKAAKELEDLEATYKMIEADAMLIARAVMVFGPAGVRAHILDTVTPFLNARTAHYLATLADGNISATWSTLTRTAKGELRERFAIDVQHARGGSSFALISGGEKRKVRLACALALQDMVASRATKPIDLFIGDEIDDALDVAGLERLMVILEEKARERGTVLVISHNDLNDWIRESVTVIKEGGKSRVEGVLCR